MNNKVIISVIISFLVIVVGLGVWNFNLKNNFITEKNNSLNDMIENNITNAVNISTAYITDECINEWNDYAKYINEDVESASTNVVNENLHYLVKSIDGYINIYYLDDFNEEILYKKTDISTEYLSVEDLDNLKHGIEVIGSKELNQLLEDFE